MPLPHPYPCTLQMAAGTAEARQGGKGKPANGQWAEPPVQVWPGWKGRGLRGRAHQMPSAPGGPLKSRCAARQARVSAEVPCLLGCLLPPTWAACPGHALLGSLLHGVLHALLKSISLSLLSGLFLALCLSLSTLFPSLPCSFFFPSYHHLSFFLVSFHLFLSFLFSVSLFMVSLSFPIFFSFSLPLSFSACGSFCVLLSILEVQELRDKSTLPKPWGRLALPSEGLKQDGERGRLGWGGLVSFSYASGMEPWL